MTVPILSVDVKAASKRRAGRSRSHPLLAVLATFLAVCFVTVLLRPAWPGYIHQATRLRIGSLDEGTKRTYLSPNVEGVLLFSNQSISSPNGAYTLTLQADGDLVLARNIGENGAKIRLWWTSTGDGRAQNGHKLVLEPTTRVPILKIKTDVGNAWSTAWHSDLEQACRDRALFDPDTEKTSKLGLALSDSGQLTLLSTCHLYTHVTTAAKSSSLAVIVAGLHRTLSETCDSHVQFLASHPSFSRVDIFAYILHTSPNESTDSFTTAIELETRIRECYGSRLRSLTLISVDSIEEEYPGGATQMLRPCKRRVQRLNNQLKTLREAGRKYWEWTVKEGFVHGTILRIRPDTYFQGRPGEILGFKTDAADGSGRGGGEKGRLVLVHPEGEHYFWCPRSTGRVGVGESFFLFPDRFAGWLSRSRCSRLVLRR